MVNQCVMCRKTSKNSCFLSFHRFPLNENIRIQWCKILNLEYQTLPKVSLLCSEHFSKDSFVVKPSGRRMLKKNVKPLPPEVDEQRTVPHEESCNSDTDSLSEESTTSRVTTGRNLITYEANEKAQTSNLLPVQVYTSSSTITASETELHPVETFTSISSTSLGPMTGLASATKRRRKRGRPETAGITSDEFSSPTKKKVRTMKTTIVSQKQKIKSLRSTVWKLKQKITNLNALLDHLRSKLNISETSETAIRSTLSGTSQEVFVRMLQGPDRQKYTPALRSFALTLSFYSPRAYSFVRNTFNKSLPHPATLRKWYQTVDGGPGFTYEALVALQLKVKESKHDVICNLVFDEMSIRRQVEWTGSHFTGYVNIGTKLDGDVLPEAREVLVFMLVCLNGSWKLPVGYFLLDGLSGAEKASAVQKCLSFVHESGVIVTSLTFDGAPTNLTMAEKLGCNFNNPQHLKTSFSHPITAQPVYIILDPCHMIKLIRNTFASQKITDIDCNDISWTYLERLVHFQYDEGLHAATKLRFRHLQFAKEKMKVKIATQTLSKSVADALHYLCDDLKLPAFAGASPTCKFIQIFNDLFDILNSRNRFSKYIYKKPLSPQTKDCLFRRLHEAKEYILGLRIANVPVLNTGRKTGFLGLLICVESFFQLYKLYVEENNKMKYILSYKLSQDHLELFFGTIRSRGGFNNNPTARQFEAAYKRLIVHCEVRAPDSGNVQNLEMIPILHCSSGGSVTRSDANEDLERLADYQSSLERSITNLETFNFVSANSWYLTDYILDVVMYIAGFVVKQIISCVTCSKCKSLLKSEETYSLLQKRKEYSNLTKASNLVVTVCQAGEKYFRFLHKTRNIFNKKISDLLTLCITNTIQSLPGSFYNQFGDHFLEDEVVDGHAFFLIKLILRHYFTIRIHHETKRASDSPNSERIRSFLTKTIHFKNQ